MRNDDLIRQLAERLGLNPSVCRFDSCLGHRRWLGRQLADHLGLEPGMLWVRLPPELLKLIQHVLAEQPGVLATLSRWRSSVQIRSGTLAIARYANWQSGEAQTFVVCGFDSHPCY